MEWIIGRVTTTAEITLGVKMFKALVCADDIDLIEKSIWSADTIPRTKGFSNTIINVNYKIILGSSKDQPRMKGLNPIQAVTAD